MDGPVYKLEQVVHSKAGMEDFEGDRKSVV